MSKMDLDSLVGLPGHKILMHLTSKNFNKVAPESNKLFDIIDVSTHMSNCDQEFIEKVTTENKELKTEQARIRKSNLMYERVIKDETGSTTASLTKADNLSRD